MVEIINIDEIKSMDVMQEMTDKEVDKAQANIIVRTLLDNPNIARASELLGISIDKVNKIMATEEFRRQYNTAKQSQLQQYTDNLSNTIPQVTATLSDIVSDVDSPPMCKIVAGRTLLEYALKFREVTEISQRIARIEENQRRMITTTEWENV